MSRQKPNILITGTPGTGKSTTAATLHKNAPGMQYVDIGALVREKQLHQGWDEEFQSYILDEERVRAMLAHGVAKAFAPR